ncbi:MAG: hypothetical protein ACYCQK_06315 [Acidiferrobacteraceae bacterium]
MDPHEQPADRGRRPKPGRTHADAERFSLRLHEEAAALIRANPGLIDKARDNIRRWKRQLGDQAPRDLDVWAKILTGPLEDTLAMMVARNETSDRLRQNSPFAGIVPNQRRFALLRERQDET